jgi:hypothetical protein
VLAALVAALWVAFVSTLSAVSLAAALTGSQTELVVTLIRLHGLENADYLPYIKANFALGFDQAVDLAEQQFGMWRVRLSFLALWTVRAFYAAFDTWWVLTHIQERADVTTRHVHKLQGPERLMAIKNENDVTVYSRAYTLMVNGQEIYVEVPHQARSDNLMSSLLGNDRIGKESRVNGSFETPAARLPGHTVVFATLDGRVMGHGFRVRSHLVTPAHVVEQPGFGDFQVVSATGKKARVFDVFDVVDFETNVDVAFLTPRKTSVFAVLEVKEAKFSKDATQTAHITQALTLEVFQTSLGAMDASCVETLEEDENFDIDDWMMARLHGVTTQPGSSGAPLEHSKLVRGMHIGSPKSQVNAFIPMSVILMCQTMITKGKESPLPYEVDEDDVFNDQDDWEQEARGAGANRFATYYDKETGEYAASYRTKSGKVKVYRGNGQAGYKQVKQALARATHSKAQKRAQKRLAGFIRTTGKETSFLGRLASWAWHGAVGKESPVIDSGDLDEVLLQGYQNALQPPKGVGPTQATTGAAPPLMQQPMQRSDQVGFQFQLDASSVELQQRLTTLADHFQEQTARLLALEGMLALSLKSPTAQGKETSQEEDLPKPGGPPSVFQDGKEKKKHKPSKKQREKKRASMASSGPPEEPKSKSEVSKQT